MAWKNVVLIAAVLLVGVFILQNTRVVEVRFLFWKLEMSRSILLFAVLGVGAVLGWLFATVRRS